MQLVPIDLIDQGPHHLAHTVLRALSLSASALPETGTLERFFDTLYQASFRMDPSQTGRFVWQGQAELLEDTDWAEAGHLRLTPPLPFQVSSLIALLAATDAQASLLVSGTGPQSLAIHAILRRSPSYLQPGLFQVDVLGPAHLKVDAGLDAPLELRRNRLHVSASQVFERGPVRERLSALLQDLFPAVQAKLPFETASSPLLSAEALLLPGGNILRREQSWPEALEQFWIDALAELLRCILETRFGGLVALTPCRSEPAYAESMEKSKEETTEETTEEGETENRRKEDWLRAPQEAVFPQVRQCLEGRAVQAITRQAQAVRSFSERLAAHQGLLPDDPALQEPSAWLKPPESDPETASALQFLAALAQSDGVLHLNAHLDLVSFGGEPAGQLPERVYLAGDEMASEAHLSPISIRSFGPRNQALLRLCQQNPSAIGFAVTQDKEMRAMLWHGGRLVIWNTLALPRP